MAHDKLAGKTTRSLPLCSMFSLVLSWFVVLPLLPPFVYFRAAAADRRAPQPRAQPKLMISSLRPLKANCLQLPPIINTNSVCAPASGERHTSPPLNGAAYSRPRRRSSECQAKLPLSRPFPLARRRHKKVSSTRAS